MTTLRLQTVDIIKRAESYADISAGMAPLDEVLKAPSYLGEMEQPWEPGQATGVNPYLTNGETPAVLVLGLYHPANKLPLDYWDEEDTPGNRRLREISQDLKHWLKLTYDVVARPLPYHVEKGGLFLKDAAVLSGLGIIGKSNLLIHPRWGPRIRLRSILIEAKVEPTQRCEEFNPCKNCKVFCQKACPKNAFPEEIFERSLCMLQMDENVDSKTFEVREGERKTEIQYCRACEFACPVGS